MQLITAEYSRMVYKIQDETMTSEESGNEDPYEWDSDESSIYRSRRRRSRMSILTNRYTDVHMDDHLARKIPRKFFQSMVRWDETYKRVLSRNTNPELFGLNAEVSDGRTTAAEVVGQNDDPLDDDVYIPDEWDDSTSS